MFDPVKIETVFPTLVRPVLKLRADSFPLKRFQSFDESAQVAEVEASQRERVDQDTESPLLGIQIEIVESLLLNVFQSLLVIYPFVPVVA